MPAPHRLSPALLLALGTTLAPAVAYPALADTQVRFTLQNLPASVDADSRVLVIDADQDDLPDIFVARAAGGGDVLLRQREPGKWEVRALNDAAPPTYAALALDLNRDFRPDLILARATGLTLLLNDGQGGFRDATPSAWRQPLAKPAHLAAGDVNKDGWPDLYVRYAGGASLWRHSGALTEGVPEFLDATIETGLTTTAGTGEAILFDADDDADLDLALAGATLVIMENDGRGVFIRHDTGIAGPWAQLSAADDNNDGRLDLLLSADRAGKPAATWAHSHGALQYRAARLRGGAKKGVALRATNLDNDGRMDLVQSGAAPRAWQRDRAGGYIGVRAGLDKSRVLAVADLDRDGHTDLLTAGADGGLAASMQQRNEHHWIGVRLRGQENATVTGARVVVYMPDGSQITQQYLAGEDELRFGLGRRSVAGGIRIHWPSGRYTQIETLGIDQHLGFVEPTAAAGGRHVRLKEPLLGVQRRSQPALSCR